MYDYCHPRCCCSLCTLEKDREEKIKEVKRYFSKHKETTPKTIWEHIKSKFSLLKM